MSRSLPQSNGRKTVAPSPMGAPENDARFRILAETASDVIVTIDEASTMLFINAAAESVFGYSIDEMVGRELTMLMPEHMRKRHRAGFGRFLKSGKQNISWKLVQLPGRHKDGQEIPLELSFAEYSDGGRRMFTGIIRDITRREEAEQARLATEARYRTLFDHAPDGILLIDPESCYLDANDSICRMLGYTRKELIGLNVSDIVSTNEIAHIGNAMDTIQAFSDYHREWRLKRKDGSEIVCEVIGTMMPDGNLVAMIHDITERKRSEIASVQLSAIVESSFDAIIGKDMNSVVTSWNKGAERIFGYTAKEILGQSIMRLIPPERWDEENQILEKIGRGESLQHFETVRQTKTGELIHVSITASPIKNAVGEVVGVSKVARDISERRKSERAVRESDQDFRGLVEASTQFTWTADEVGASEELYQWLSDLSGRQVNDVQGITDVIHPDDVEPMMKAWKEASENRTVFSEVCRYRRRNGDYSYMASRGVQVFNEDGTFRKWIGTFNDITERKTAENALRDSETLNRAVLDSMRSNIAVLAADGTIKAVNRSWRDFALENGLSDPLFRSRIEIGSNYLDVRANNGHKLSDEEIAATGAIRDVLEGRAVGASLEYASHLAKAERWFCMNVTRLLAKEGGAVVSHSDITVQKLAEIALKNSEAELQMIADTVPTIIVYIDYEQRIGFANKACLRWFEKTQKEVIGAHISEVLHEDIHREVQPEVERVLAGNSLTFERASLLDKGKGFLRFNYVPDFDGEGKVRGFFMFIVDLTDIKQAEARLLKSEEQLLQAQKLESIGRLAGGIAHDFNNMLTAINGYSELSLLRLAEGDPVRRHVEEIKMAGERSAALTRQLLAFSRRQMLEVKVLDINQIINGSIVMLQRVIGDDIEIVANLDVDLAKIKGDAGQLSQILMNLVVNSRDAMPQGGTITIETGNAVMEEKFVLSHAGAKVGDYARLKISDTGTGIDEETRKYIFEPFFTTREIGKGTGLGLSMVYGIVKQLDGYVSLESGPDEAAVFEIYFPVVAENTVRHVPDSKTDRAAGGSETILLVEDEPLVRRLCRQILESDGYDVKEAENGVAALELYHDLEGKIDLLMTDVVMSQMSGRELAEKLVAEQPGLKVLFTSGYTGDFALTRDAIAPEMNFIQKPFTSAQIAQKIREVLDGEIA